MLHPTHPLQGSLNCSFHIYDVPPNNCGKPFFGGGAPTHPVSSTQGTGGFDHPPSSNNFGDGWVGPPTYYQLRHVVDYKPIGLEVTGGMGTTALALFNDIVAFAQAAKADKLAPSEWSWSAQGFLSYWMMRISFCVVKITALAVHHGVRRAPAAHAEL